jgi:hypothetical protein
VKATCPCCGYRTLDEPHVWEICPICFWEDDPFQAAAPGLQGGPNGVSLRDAQRNFADLGACRRADLRHVRPPGEGDRRDPAWHPAP